MFRLPWMQKRCVPITFWRVFPFVVLLLLLFVPPMELQAATEVQSATQEIPAGETVFYLQVRVIFAGTTGIYGNIGPDLSDMRNLLSQSFHYPSYELSNRIRLSLFGDEEASALVFPDHYLRVIPKGKTSKNHLKAKVELYHVPVGRDSRVRLNTGVPPNGLQFQEREKEGQHSTVFPIAGSAMILTPGIWDAFGGVPVRVNIEGQVNSNTLSSSSFLDPNANLSPGIQKYLILGIRLEEVRE